MKKRYICLFEVYLFAAEDPVTPCALVGMTLFRNVYVHVPKRAGDQYQCNERDKYSDYLQCPVTKCIIILQNIIFSIILITKSIQFTILSSVCLKSSNDHRLNSNGTHVKWTHKIRLPEK